MPLRRRTTPYTWSGNEIDKLVDAAYLGEQSTFSSTGAVVIKMPASLIPRELLRLQHSMHGVEWQEVQWWGFQWHIGDIEYAQMGGDPDGCICAHGACSEVAEARRMAQGWIGGDALEISYASSPPFLTALLHFAVRRGPGHWRGRWADQ